jgi:hypothetical protein
VESFSTVMSAHRTPDDVTKFARQAHTNGMRVIIAGAGGAVIAAIGEKRDGTKESLANVRHHYYRGLQALRAAGGCTLAQDQASCVVYGMPRAAVELGAVERVAPLADLARAVCDLTGVGSGHGIAI